MAQETFQALFSTIQALFNSHSTEFSVMNALRTAEETIPCFSSSSANLSWSNSKTGYWSLRLWSISKQLNEDDFHQNTKDLDFDNTMNKTASSEDAIDILRDYHHQTWITFLEKYSRILI